MKAVTMQEARKQKGGFKMKNGAQGIRTLDPYLAKVVLSQLS
jgi:hypothetical protein